MVHKDDNDSSIPTRDDLLAQVHKHQEQIKALEEQIKALEEELQDYLRETQLSNQLSAPVKDTALQLDIQEQDVEGQNDIHTNFIATGPANAPGFLAQASGNFRIGVRSIGYTGVVGAGSHSDLDKIKDTVGVKGMTTTLSGATLGDGVGVQGFSQGGVGVQGSSQGSFGVQGFSQDSFGVQGFSPKSVGVHGATSANGTGVFGTSYGGAGVFGNCYNEGLPGGGLPGLFKSDHVGVYGLCFDSGDSLEAGTGVNGVGAIGVKGRGEANQPDLRDISYGGWFEGQSAPLHLEPSKTPAPPTSGKAGDLFVDNSGALWFCTNSGDPATWKKVQLM